MEAEEKYDNLHLLDLIVCHIIIRFTKAQNKIPNGDFCFGRQSKLLIYDDFIGPMPDPTYS